MKRRRREILDEALRYLQQAFPEGVDREKHRLHKNLNFFLCDAEARLHDAFGEVTRKDIALLVEAWILAQGTGHNRKRALVSPTQAEEP